MNYVIIGAGAAGLSAAEELRKLDPAAGITILSAEPEIYSRCMLHQYLGGERSLSSMRFVPEDFFERLNIDVLKNCRVTSIQEAEHNVVLEDGTLIPYDRLLIATGATYFIPPIPNFRDAENVFGFREIEDIKRITASSEKLGECAVIIGGGLIGLDAAYGMMRRGYQVTLIEKEPRLMPLQADDYVSGLLKQVFEEEGCHVLLGAEVKDSVTDENDMITKVVLADGTDITCDFVVAAASVKPQMDFLEGTSIQALYMNYHIHTVLSRFLKKTDIHVNKGLEVDAYMRTNSRDIYAAGDVTGLSAIWPDARLMGRCAARNMCAGDTHKPELYQFKNTANFYGLVLFSAGKTVVDEERYEVLVQQGKTSYRKLILKDGILEGVLMTGDLSNAGVYLHALTHRLNLDGMRGRLFRLSFSDWYGIDEESGEYCYTMEGRDYS